MKKDHGTDLSCLLFITFLVLKLTGVVDWSWWLVTAPLWGPVALGAALLVVGGAVVLFFVGVIVTWETWDRMTWRRRNS